MRLIDNTLDLPGGSNSVLIGVTSSDPCSLDTFPA